MKTILFEGQGWESWDVDRRPVTPDGMPVLIDDDLVLEDASGPRPCAVVNRWLRELPSSGCSSPSSWPTYGRALRAWMEFLAERGIELFDTRPQLKAALSAYAVHRACGPIEARFGAATWDQHVSILAVFYKWATAEGHAQAEPFTYRQAKVAYGHQAQVQQVNMAVRRRPKTHVTIKYLASDFEQLFLKALAGLDSCGQEDTQYRGRELARNAAVGQLALSTGLRRQEFTYLLTQEIPPLLETLAHAGEFVDLAGACAVFVASVGRVLPTLRGHRFTAAERATVHKEHREGPQYGRLDGNGGRDRQGDHGRGPGAAAARRVTRCAAGWPPTSAPSRSGSPCWRLARPG